MVNAPDPHVLRVVGIDPGTVTLGYAVIDLDMETQAITLREVATLDGHQNARVNRDLIEVHGDRKSRLHAHKSTLTRLFTRTQPYSVITETPFMKRRMPTAFAALTECVVYIHMALYNYRTDIELYGVDPPTAKMAVGATGRAEKDEVRDAILKLDWLENPDAIDIASLDEHSTDAIAIAIYRVLVLKGYLNEGVQ